MNTILEPVTFVLIEVLEGAESVNELSRTEAIDQTIGKTGRFIHA